jgi:hypothetical protein
MPGAVAVRTAPTLFATSRPTPPAPAAHATPARGAMRGRVFAIAAATQTYTRTYPVDSACGLAGQTARVGSRLPVSTKDHLRATWLTSPSRFSSSLRRSHRVACSMLSPTPFRRGADMKRRDLISSALGITAGAAGLMFPGLPAIGSTLAGRSTVRPSAQVADPSFASGAVIAAFPTGLVIRSASGQRAIRTHAQTVTWKETFIPTGTIQLGDVVDVSGRPQMDESLLADRIWVNIVRFEFTARDPRARVRGTHAAQSST